MASQFSEAVRQMREAELRCPKCPAMNRPGALIIRLDQDGAADCGACGTHFTPSTKGIDQ